MAPNVTVSVAVMVSAPAVSSVEEKVPTPFKSVVFAGNTADPATVASQVDKLKHRYGIEKLAWVGDRGMLTQARIDTVLRPAGLDWVSSLRAPQMAALAHDKGPFQPSLFDERNLLLPDSLQNELVAGHHLGQSPDF